MVQSKKSKFSKRRGSKTFGHGSMKKQRGKGNIGGKGKSGAGKRSSSKKPTYQTGVTGYYGKHGFTNQNPNPVNVINLKLIEDNFENLVKQEFIKENDGFFEINLAEMGFDKLLGNQELSRKYKIFVKSTSKKASLRVTEAGGEIVN